MGAVRRLRRERDDADAQVRALTRTFEDIVAAAEDVSTDDEHDPEGHTIAWERQQVAALLLAARDRVADLDAALRRIEEGTYGRCISCGGDIAPERLAALPAAVRCVTCAA